MICPKCGTNQPDAVECKNCHVIVAKYRKREEPPPPEESWPAPGGAAAPGPGGGKGVFGAGGGFTPGGGYSRYGSGLDDDTRRKVEASASTKRFIAVALVLAVVFAGLGAFLSFFRVFQNRNKLDVDVARITTEMDGMEPVGARQTITRYVGEYPGFLIKDDLIKVSWRQMDGSPIDISTIRGGAGPITAKVIIEFTIETTIVGFPYEFKVEASDEVSRIVSMSTYRQWITDPYGDGSGADEGDYVGEYEEGGDEGGGGGGGEEWGADDLPMDEGPDMPGDWE